jgi:hypothetical protein
VLYAKKYTAFPLPTVWETTARQLAKCECKMIFGEYFSPSTILASWHVWAKYDNLLLVS